VLLGVVVALGEDVGGLHLLALVAEAVLVLQRLLYYLDVVGVAVLVLHYAQDLGSALHCFFLQTFVQARGVLSF